MEEISKKAVIEADGERIIAKRRRYQGSPLPQARACG